MQKIVKFVYLFLLYIESNPSNKTLGIYSYFVSNIVSTVDASPPVKMTLTSSLSSNFILLIMGS